MSKQINYQKLEALIDITEKNNNDIDTYRKIIKSFIITDFNENVCRNFNKELNNIKSAKVAFKIYQYFTKFI